MQSVSSTLAGQKLVLQVACEAWAEWLEHRRRCNNTAQCAVEIERLRRAERLNARALAAVEEVGR